MTQSASGYPATTVLGRLTNGKCDLRQGATKRVWSVDGATLPPFGETFPRPSPLWNGAGVQLRDLNNPTVIHDVMLGRLSNKLVTPRFKLGPVGMRAFRGVNLRMRCAPAGGIPTYRNVSLSFRRTVVPRHGFVDATQRYRKGHVWFHAFLRGRVVGSRLVFGRFTYRTAGSCSVVEPFTARRISR